MAVTLFRVPWIVCVDFSTVSRSVKPSNGLVRGEGTFYGPHSCRGHLKSLGGSAKLKHLGGLAGGSGIESSYQPRESCGNYCHSHRLARMELLAFLLNDFP